MSETVHRPVDPWNELTITAAAEARVHDQAQLLELRGRGDDLAAIREAYLDLLGIAPGELVLDLGCGTGVIARAAARRVWPNGRNQNSPSPPGPTLLANPPPQLLSLLVDTACYAA
ncbi:MAG TPA: hypothetical protein VFH48_01700 [Chloroflexota bacterium]|nr:hypothetical protein [Chloroflexota bacterium]